MSKPTPGAAPSWNSSSTLKSGPERFLSRIVSNAFGRGHRTPEDFLRHFPPSLLMEALEGAPELRKDILVTAAGVHEKIARRKTAESAAEDLKIALDEGVTTAAQVLEIIQADGLVRYLNRPKLFAFLVEDGFYLGQKTGADHERAVERLLTMVEAAIGEKLLAASAVAESIGFDAIAHRLPLKELQKALEHALALGSRGEPFTERALFEIVSLRALLSYVPMEQIWTKVMVPKVLAPAGLADSEGRVAQSHPESAREPVSRRSKEPPPKPPASTNGRKITEDARRPPALPRASEHDVDSLLDASDGRSAATEEDARSKVVERLRGMGRLPPRHADLSTPVLLSIDSMYAELLEATSDEEREECIRDSFPNEQHMTQALLAIIELLDPNIDVNDPVIREADLDSLIKVVLFEERHRFEQAHPSQRSAPSALPASPPSVSPQPQTAVPPLPPSAGRRSMPPPLPPRVTTQNPPPPPSASAEKPR